MWDGNNGVKALAIGLGLAVLVTAGFPVAAYDNKDLGKSKSYLAGGAHRLINQLALDLLVEQAAEDPILRYYDFAPDKKALGIEKLRPQDDPDGQWYAELFTPTGSDVVRNGQTRRSSSRSRKIPPKPSAAGSSMAATVPMSRKNTCPGAISSIRSPGRARVSPG